MHEVVGVREVHGIRRFTLGRRAWGIRPITAHCYLVGGTLIDAGTPRTEQWLVEQVGAAVEHVLLTHQHEDHVGAAGRLAERGVPVHAPAGALGVLAEPNELPRYRDVIWGVPRPVEAIELADKVTTDEATWEVIPAPGHSPDHVVLHEPDRRWLFVGDAVLAPRRELRFDEDLERSVETYRSLLELDLDLLFPGHGGIVEDPVAALQGLIDHYESLRRDVWRLRHEGDTIATITRKLLGPEGFIRYYTGGEFSKKNLVRELVRWPP